MRMLRSTMAWTPGWGNAKVALNKALCFEGMPDPWVFQCPLIVRGEYVMCPVSIVLPHELFAAFFEYFPEEFGTAY